MLKPHPAWDQHVAMPGTSPQQNAQATKARVVSDVLPRARSRSRSRHKPKTHASSASQKKGLPAPNIKQTQHQAWTRQITITESNIVDKTSKVRKVHKHQGQAQTSRPSGAQNSKAKKVHRHQDRAQTSRPSGAQNIKAAKVHKHQGKAQHSAATTQDIKKQAKVMCYKLNDNRINAKPPADLPPLVPKDDISVGEDCAGLGTFALACQSSCKAAKKRMSVTFVTEKDGKVRKMHRALAKSHGVPKPGTGYLKCTTEKQDVPSVDLYGVGPPCQPWSGCGSGDGIKDKQGRGIVIFECVKFITTCPKPKAFILEEVATLCYRHPVEFGRILKDLTEGGFEVTWKIQNPLKNGGAQSRNRIYMVGIRKDCCFNEFCFPQDLKKTPPVNKFLDQRPVSVMPDFSYTEEVNHTKYWSRIQKEILSNQVDEMHLPTYIMDLAAGESFGQMRKNACPCITKSRGACGGYFIDDQKRYTSLEEIGRLQGFTTKDVATLEQTMVGNFAIGGAFGNSMHKTVLERLIPRVLFAAGLIPTKLEDHWKKADWKATPPDALWPDCITLPEQKLLLCIGDSREAT